MLCGVRGSFLLWQQGQARLLMRKIVVTYGAEGIGLGMADCGIILLLAGLANILPRHATEMGQGEQGGRSAYALPGVCKCAKEQIMTEKLPMTQVSLLVTPLRRRQKAGRS